jgi:uncharacterized protein
MGPISASIAMIALTTTMAPITNVLRVLPQLVPSSACFRCDVCCRFPDPDSSLRPYFTGEEISRAVDLGLDAHVFPDRHGCQVTVIPDPQGEGFVCPAFESESHTCHIYEQRPLDCQLYPLALMWSAAHDEVVLGWDAKCPFMSEQLPDSIRNHAERILNILQQRPVLRQISDHPRLVGRYQEDVVILASLPELTQALYDRWGAQPLRRLISEDLERLVIALKRSGLAAASRLAAFSAPYHYIWNGLLPYGWSEIQGAFCLFVQSPGGWFMPLPPLTAGSMEGPLAEAFRLMRRWNGPSAVSRVENIPASLVDELESMGYRVTPKDSDYLYRAADLVHLAGDRYKAHRALCNRVERGGDVSVEPYRASDRLACRALFQQWQRQKRRQTLEAFAALLLDDTASAHEVTWSHHSECRLVGSVLRINGEIRAYTFGYWLTDNIWCVLLEVADRTIPGLAQYLFRDSCHKAFSQGAEFINTMDDSGLLTLRLSKLHYHPLMQIPNFICSEAPQT